MWIDWSRWKDEEKEQNSFRKKKDCNADDKEEG